MRRIAESVSYIVARKDSMARLSMIFLGTLLILRSSSGFLITLVEPSLLLVSPGARVNLSCTVDSHYEWCKFYNPSGEFCDFEWKRSENNITMQECALHNRVRVVMLGHRLGAMFPCFRLHFTVFTMTSSVVCHS